MTDQSFYTDDSPIIQGWLLSMNYQSQFMTHYKEFYGDKEVFSGVKETEISPFMNRFTNCQMMMTSSVQKVQQTVKQKWRMGKGSLKYQRKLYYGL